MGEVQKGIETGKMRYYISDLHFGHGRLNQEMDKRGFESVEAMDEYMILQWNSRVREKDEVVILGDFCMSRDGAVVNELLDRLNGTKDLIIGNHDLYLKSRAFEPDKFQWIENYHELKDNKRKIILSHYPIMCYKGQYWQNEQGQATAYMLYGHVHNTFDEYLVNSYIELVKQQRRPAEEGSASEIPCQMINCFCMFSDYVPLTLDEWIEIDRKRRAEIRVEDYYPKK